MGASLGTSHVRDAHLVAVYSVESLAGSGKQTKLSPDPKRQDTHLGTSDVVSEVSSLGVRGEEGACASNYSID